MPSAQIEQRLFHPGEKVSNPSRGRCAFGLKEKKARVEDAMRLKPLSGKVCLRPKAFVKAFNTDGASQTPLGEGVPSAAYQGDDR